MISQKEVWGDYWLTMEIDGIHDVFPNDSRWAVLAQRAVLEHRMCYAKTYREHSTRLESRSMGALHVARVPELSDWGYLAPPIKHERYHDLHCCCSSPGI